MTIIALTGWGQEVDRARSQEAGCSGHLVKPMNRADLQSCSNRTSRSLRCRRNPLPERPGNSGERPPSAMRRWISSAVLPCSGAAGQPYLSHFVYRCFSTLADFHTHPGRANRIVDLLLGIFVEEKAITIFAILFGVSMALQWEHCQARGESYVRLGVRRLLALFGLGIFHLVFIWNGDILTEYALAGLLILPTLWLPRRIVVGVAAVLLVLPVLPLHLPLPQAVGSACTTT